MTEMYLNYLLNTLSACNECVLIYDCFIQTSFLTPEMNIRDAESTKTPRRPIKKVTMPHAAVEAEKELISVLDIPDTDPDEQGDMVITLHY
jgi:hypothetical protein